MAIFNQRINYRQNSKQVLLLMFCVLIWNLARSCLPGHSMTWFAVYVAAGMWKNEKNGSDLALSIWSWAVITTSRLRILYWKNSKVMWKYLPTSVYISLTVIFVLPDSDFYCTVSAKLKCNIFNWFKYEYGFKELIMEKTTLKTLIYGFKVSLEETPGIQYSTMFNYLRSVS